MVLPLATTYTLGADNGRCIDVHRLEISMLFFANIFGWILAHGRQLIIGAVILAVVLTSAIIYTRCTRVKPLTPQQIEKAQRAIQENDRKQLEEVFAEAEADQKIADGVVANAAEDREKAIAEAKAKAESMSLDEMAAELEKKK